MRIVGIDPGKDGAIALIDTTAWTIAITAMPLEIANAKGKEVTSPTGLVRVLKAAAPDAGFLEEVHAMPGQGTVSMFSFGRAYGICLGALCATECMAWTITPQVWKAATKTPKDKKQATQRAEMLFPSAYKAFQGPRGGKKDGLAEAALLAFYGCLHSKQVPTRPLTLVAFPE